ncbi:MAG: undecaprenyl-diphosphatase UppP [Pyrinomonadaceae bacterium]|nr:undecaprenyl-diphosphatase UppP [Pyrinomonadaceae bacterium]MCX7638865.1 undecaprenyl-diphosphatase UppP [Pyrinomonadaceae bacterium]MDW8304999.1 undecaprenyl-diphosphatase UppP [Acidobacteriota bacterium]
MNIWQAIILGIVQGLTEFIPISSTAHLVFASRWTNIYNQDPQKITATMAVIQLGTLFAVFIYFASDIWNITRSFLVENWSLVREGNLNRERLSKLSSDAWLGWVIIIGSVPIGVFGIVFKEVIEGPLTKNLWLIASMMIVIAILLVFAEVFGSRSKGMEELGVKEALIIGFAQALALIPGASRSGSTIMGGLFAGLKREAAARFSFLLMIPAITLSGLLELREAIYLLSQDDILALVVGSVVAGVTGYASIWFLLAFLRKYSTFIFIAYRIVVGFVILVMLWKGVILP